MKLGGGGGRAGRSARCPWPSFRSLRARFLKSGERGRTSVRGGAAAPAAAAALLVLPLPAAARGSTASRPMPLRNTFRTKHVVAHMLARAWRNTRRFARNTCICATE